MMKSPVKKRFGDARDIIGSMPTMKPRTREGKIYPGGKHMRKAYAKLCARKEARESAMGLSIKNPLRHANIPGSMKI